MEVDEEFEAELKLYPSNFDLYDEAKLFPKEYVQKIKGKLIQELEANPYDTAMETLRAWNLISFLNFLLGNEKGAFEYNSKVLELSMENVIGLCNKAWFLLKMQEQYSVIKDLCKELKGCIRDRNTLLVAKAEKAFCYSRFGVKRYGKSRQIFGEVLVECIQSIESHQQESQRSLESDDPKQMNIQTDNFCVWNFGYALTFKRALNFNNTQDTSSIDLSKQAVEKVCDLYCRIIYMEGDSKCLLRYRARSYVELGSLVYNVRKSKSRFPNDVKDILSNHRDLWMRTEQFYLKAITLCPSDVFVLGRSGTYFRYVGEICKSIELLEQAVEIRGTAFAHHHLALTLKRKLEIKWLNYSSSASCNDSPISKERQNASRNISGEFEGAECQIRHPKSANRIDALPKHNTPDTQAANSNDISNETHLERRRGNANRYPPRKHNNLTERTAVSDRKAFVKMIKSPQKPPFIDKEQDAETIKQIMFHLDKSVELSNNCGAIYDKGLLYRQIGENEKALVIFKTLIRNEGEYCSLVQLSNAFEQSGLCLYEILSQSEEGDQCKQDDMRAYFKKSIEISCSIVSKIPFLKDCWVSAPTLRCFLSGKAKTSEYLKDLVFLSKKFKDYGEVINILKELKELAMDENERIKIDLQLIENYLSNESYDDAILALDVISCLQNGYELIDENIYLRAHIDGGINALEQENFEMARLRFRNALDFYRHKQEGNGDSENDTETEEETFDIFILCNEENENKVKTLQEILKGFKLRVTMNLLDLLPGASKMFGICQQIGRSNHYLIVIDDEPLSKTDEHYFGMMQEIVFTRNYGHIVIVKATHGAQVPLFISKYPNIEMNFENVDCAKEFFKNDMLCKEVRTLLFKLASSKQTA